MKDTTFEMKIRINKGLYGAIKNWVLVKEERTGIRYSVQGTTADIIRSFLFDIEDNKAAIDKIRDAYRKSKK